MELLFLGTGAADWSPADAPNGDYRRRCSVLVDRTLLIDPGPDVYGFVEDHGDPALLSGVQAVLVTHRHADHFCPETVKRLNVPVTAIAPFAAETVAGYRVTAYPANHGTAENPLHYAVEAPDGKRFFYGCDGAWLFYEVVQELKKRPFDLMIFDGTVGDIPGDYRIFEHNNLTMVEQLCATFRTYGNRRFMISHMARTLHTDRATLERRMAAAEIEVAYDGLTVTL